MKRSSLCLITAVLIMMVSVPTVFAGGPNGPQQNDCENPVGNLYKWLRDADGDGIPNCEDPDWTAPKDGSGYGPGPDGGSKYQKGKSDDDAVSLGGDQNKHRYNKTYRKKYEGTNSQGQPKIEK